MFEKPEIFFPTRIYGSIDDAKKDDDKRPIILTHNGRFHCDDVLAVGMLFQLKEFRNAAVVRSRSSEDIKEATVVVDVGSTYDVEKKRFDHHQPSFNEYYHTDYEKISRMSSCGLIFKHFGADLFQQLYSLQDPKVLDYALSYFYKLFLFAIDALDNGVNISNDGQEGRYIITTDLTSRIARLNPRWYEKEFDNISEKQFLQALKVAMEEFVEQADNILNSWLQAFRIFDEAILERYKTHPTGRIIEVDRLGPLSNNIEILEKQYQIEGTILFAVYQYDKNQWRARGIPITSYSFDLRLPFPERFRNAKKDSFNTMFPGLTFVHRNGFLAEAVSREKIIDFIILTLEEANIK